jgi:hypothetical protein
MNAGKEAADVSPCKQEKVEVNMKTLQCKIKIIMKDNFYYTTESDDVMFLISKQYKQNNNQFRIN